MKHSLSVIVPTIEPSRLIDIYEQLISAVGSPYTWELVCVGPKLPPPELIDKTNFKFYIDKGCPARAFQIGACFCDGDYLAFIPDDSRVVKNAFTECIRLANMNSPKDGIILRYSEGVNFQGNSDENPAYWVGRTHSDQQRPGVLPEWNIAPLFMYNTAYYREIGGLDCRFEHVNMNTHDLAYRVQKMGGKMHPSPTKVAALNWDPNFSRSILFQAYVQNDEPLFRQLYNEYDPNRLKIDLSNWVNAPAEWPRRYK